MIQKLFDQSHPTVGLEIGTSKICVMVGEQDPVDGCKITGIGQSASRGVRKGEITEPSLALEDIRNAIADAEHLANQEIRRVYLGITGNHIGSFTKKGVHPIVSAGRPINSIDLQDAIKNAKNYSLSGELHQIHGIRQLFSVDEHLNVVNPIGMTGTRVSVDMHAIYGNFERMKRVVELVNQLHLEVEDVVFNGLASVLSLLNPSQKEKGTLVLDMGAGTTEYIIYSKGVVRHAGILAVGGDHVTNDLACGLKVPLGVAEELKVQYGSALPEPSEWGGASEWLKVEVEDALYSIPRGQFHSIMAARYQETFQIIEQILSSQNLLRDLRGGVVVSGGGARTADMIPLLQQIFQMPVTLGDIQTVPHLPATLNQVEFATAIGLVKFGLFQNPNQGEAGVTPVSSWKRKILQFLSGE